MEQNTDSIPRTTHMFSTDFQQKCQFNSKEKVFSTTGCPYLPLSIKINSQLDHRPKHIPKTIKLPPEK